FVRPLMQALFATRAVRLRIPQRAETLLDLSGPRPRCLSGSEILRRELLVWFPQLIEPALALRVPRAVLGAGRYLELLVRLAWENSSDLMSAQTLFLLLEITLPESPQNSPDA